MRFAYADGFDPREMRGPRAHFMRGHHHRGPGGPGPFGPRSGRGRARRGNVRAAALLLLEEKPLNGYAIMQELETRTDGLWRPSPGAVYPALSQLEDEGLIAEVELEGKKSYELTDAGRAHVAEKREQLGIPWEEIGRDAPEGAKAVAQEMRQLAEAFQQVMRTGSETQIDEARTVLADARKALYKLLSE